MHERAFRATAVVDRLMTFSQLSHSATVQPPFHPTMMTRLLLYGYCSGI
jgi:hypothetical protein